MLKIFKNIVWQHSKNLNWYPTVSRYNGLASATVAEPQSANSQNESQGGKSSPSSGRDKESNMVKTVFATIELHDKGEDIPTPFTDSKLSQAKTVDDLLSISEGSGVSRKHALKVVSILSAWTSSNKVQFSDFEGDPRFLRLCKVLTKGAPGGKTNSRPSFAASRSEDLSTVLSVTADEEAAKLVGTITLPQMIKVLTTLSTKRRRSTLLLRTLAFNIAGSTEQMNIKECADLFYSISSLNFYDENLFEKAASNTIHLLQSTQISKSAVVGSILTSVGLLKYKNPALLDAISDWVLAYQQICRPNDIFSLFMTLAVLNHIPSNIQQLSKVLIPQLTREEAGKSIVWLEVVWSLVLLGQATPDHVQSVLNEPFIDSLIEIKSLNTSAKLKLLNIDGAAHYLVDKYKGPRIAKDHDIRTTSLELTREKSCMVNSMIDSLKSLIPENYFRTRVNTGLGFYIDAECVLDRTCNPLPLTESTGTDKIKLAIMVYDYHDMCKGKNELTGINVLAQNLLAGMGYRIVSIPYTEFRTADKIVNRVQYLESQLKEAVKN